MPNNAAAAAEAEATGQPYTYTSRAGAEITLPPMSAIKAGSYRRHRRSARDEADLMFLLLEDACDANTLAALDDLTLGELNECFGGWQRHEGVTVGEG